MTKLPLDLRNIDVPKIVSVLASTGWTVAGVEAECGAYGCETGCDYTTICVTLLDGTSEEVGGDFGHEGPTDAARDLARRLGVPLTVNGLLDG